MEKLQGAIELKNVNFRYSSNAPLLLNDCSLHIESDQFIGIIGKTGSGKSTLCRILFGFETPEEGDVLFDGQSMQKIDIDGLRKKIGFAFSGNKIFTGTIYDNLVCGRSFSDEKIKESLTVSTFNEDLEDLPMGLDTLLSNIGGLLSGGQKQKILLSRILLNDPKIVILDEGLNALDQQTAFRVLKNLKMKPRTLILTSHNMQLLRLADRIFVLDKGRIVTEGTRSELLKKEGLFRSFSEQQHLES